MLISVLPILSNLEPLSFHLACDHCETNGISAGGGLLIEMLQNQGLGKGPSHKIAPLSSVTTAQTATMSEGLKWIPFRPTGHQSHDLHRHWGRFGSEHGNSAVKDVS